MNEQKVQAEVKDICKFVKRGQFFNRNTNASKKQIERLTELGLIDMMETGWRTASGFNYHQAAAVIEAAEDAGSSKLIGGGDDWDVIKTNPSTLYVLLNEDETPYTVTFGLSQKGTFATIEEVTAYLNSHEQPNVYTVFDKSENATWGNMWLEQHS